MTIRQIILFLGVMSMLFFSCKTRKYKKPNLVSTTTVDELAISHKLKKEISSWLGVTYKYGGLNKAGIDCSAFVYEIYRRVYNIELPRSSKQQYQKSKKIDKPYLKEGDLVFFNPNTKEVSHVGIYLSKNQFVHASVSKGVVISLLTNPYYIKCFICGGRF